VVSSDKINFGENCAAGKAVGIIMYVGNWVPVWNGASIEFSVVSTGPPTIVFLGHEVEGGRPWSFGTSGCPVLLNSALAVAKRSGARRRGRQDTGGPGVLRKW